MVEPNKMETPPKGSGTGMEWNKQTVKNLLLVVCGGVLFYSVLQHLRSVVSSMGWVVSLLTPFLLGGAIAFILNVPMRAIERTLFPLEKRGKGFRRPLALLLTLIAVIGVLSLASGVIAPGIGEALSNIISQLPDAVKRLQEWLLNLEDYLPMLEETIAGWDLEWSSISAKAIELLKNWGTALVSTGSGFIGGVVSGVSTFAIGMVFAFYILMQKEKLSRQARQILYAIVPEQRADQTLAVVRLAGRTFSNFLSGQCLEACILGTLFVIAMTIFRLPYALLVGVLIALTALIPIVGAFIGCAVGALLIAITDPIKALFFIALFLLLQQLEGNLIYPHVVGSSVGLPSIWVLTAVTLGGKLMGIAGMLFFIPLCSVIYALFRGFVKARLHSRGIPDEKWMNVPAPAETPPEPPQQSNSAKK